MFSGSSGRLYVPVAGRQFDAELLEAEEADLLALLTLVVVATTDIVADTDVVAEMEVGEEEEEDELVLELELLELLRDEED